MPLSPTARTGLLAAAIAGGLFVCAGAVVGGWMLILAGSEKRSAMSTDTGKSVGLGDEEAARRGRELAKGDPKKGDRVTIAGVVTGFGAGMEDFFEAAHGADPQNPKEPDPRGPRERHLVVAWEGPVSGKTVSVRCVFPEHDDRRDTTLGAKMGSRVVVEGTVLSIGPRELILTDCKVVKVPR